MKKSGNTPTVPFGPEGNVAVRASNNINRPVIIQFNQVNAASFLTVTGVKDSKSVTLDDVTGFIDQGYIIIFDPPTKNFSFYTQLGPPVGNVLNFDSPLDFDYPIGTLIQTSDINMNVDGSATTQVFGLRGVESPQGLELSLDVHKISIHCVTDSSLDLTTFANISRLLNGLILRRRNGIFNNIFNVKSNIELKAISDFEITTAENSQQGEDGFTAKMSFNGLTELGVAIRLPLGEDLEFLIQDDFSIGASIILLEAIAEGHIVESQGL